ncbi:hypothetical protein Ocin01_17965 [Orchesella cincta]|uniref:Uncharacterized protein n=1 Tax=Orchesella cincta TaxID=48709 RepID=A0A1D2M6X2_ORCCI|nr:hypothetical protein Ocin01_17965 [Orchesella cincta]
MAMAQSTVLTSLSVLVAVLFATVNTSPVASKQKILMDSFFWEPPVTRSSTLRFQTLLETSLTVWLAVHSDSKCHSLL